MEDFVPYNRWLHQHDDDIRQEFPDRPTAALAGETGLGYYTVSRRATRMGVGKSDAFMRSSWKKGAKKKGGWKDAEVRAKNRESADQYMKAHFADTRNEDLARHFGVDVKTVRRWARRLGLVKTDSFMDAMRGRSRRQAYYTDGQIAWRNGRIAEVYPDGDEAALQALAEELGIAVKRIVYLANRNGIHRSPEKVREAFMRVAARNTKYGPEVIAALREYYPDHTTAECAEHFGIPSPIISQLAIRHKIRKSREHKHRIYSETRKRQKR